MDTIKGKLYALIKASVGAETLVFSDQNSPRPALPYWTMRIQSFRDVGDETYSQEVTNDGDQTIKGSREATIAIQRYGVDSDIACQGFVDELQKTSVNEAWQAQNISYYDIGDVLNISTALDKSVIEPRAAVDLFVRFGAIIIDRVGAIETVTNIGQTDQAIDEENIDIVATAPVVLV